MNMINERLNMRIFKRSFIGSLYFIGESLYRVMKLNNMTGILIIEHRKDWIKSMSEAIALTLPDSEIHLVSEQDAIKDYVTWSNLEVIILGTPQPPQVRLELCRQLKQHDRLKAVPLLFLVSAGEEPETRKNAVEAGADAFLTFPPELPELALQMKLMVKISRFNQMSGERGNFSVGKSPRLKPCDAEGRMHTEEMKRLAETPLGDSQTLFESILDSTTDMIWLVNADDFGLLKWNTALHDYFLKERGIEIEIGMTPSELFPEDSYFVPFWIDKFSRTLVEGSLMLEYTTYSKTRILLLNLGLLMHEDQPYGISIFAKNITEQKFTEEKLQKSNRLYGVISQINQAIVHIKEKDLLLKEVCRIAVEDGKFKMAWIGFLDKNLGAIKPFAFAGHEDGYLSVIEQISVSDIPEGRGPTGRSFREGIYVLCEDYAKDTAVSIWREEAIKRDYRSSISLPIREFGEIVGTFTLYSDIPYFFDEVEISLLTGITNDISFALESIIQEQKHLWAESALSASEEQFRNIYNNLQDAFLQADLSGNFTRVSPSALRIYGYDSEDELIGKPANMLYANPNIRESMIARLKEKGRVDDLIGEALRKDGSTFWVSMNIQFIYQNNQISGTEGVVRDISERIKAEEEIVRTNLRFQTIFEQAPMGIALSNPSTRELIEINQKFADIVGRSKEEIIELGWISVTHPNDLQEDLVQFERLNSKAVDHIQLKKRYIRPDGSSVWVNLMATTLITEDKGHPQILSMIEDITDQINNEDKIRILTSAVEQSPVSIVITGLDGEIEYVNPKFSQITGYSSEEAIGQNPRILKSGSKPSEDYKILWETITSGQEWHGEFLNVKKNGEHYFESASISPVFDEYGKIAHYIAVKEDITDRKKKEEQINTLSAVVEQSPLMILITDRSGKIEYINSEFSRFMQYTSEDIVGTTPRVFKQKLHTKESYDKMWRTLQTGQVWQSEFQNRKKDGTVFWENVTIFPLIESNGLTSNYIIIKENINEKKELISELIAAKEKAEESDRLKTSFLANMSHEIRTPMNGILGFTELLKEPNLSGNEQKFYIQVIEESGTRMLNLMNNLIDISRIESGEINVFFTSYDIKYKLEHIFDLFVREAEMKGLELKLINDFHNNDPLIKTDAQKLDTIVINLVKNAIKFTTEGCVEFGCEWKEDHYLFYVRDTGVGIDSQYREIIFDRFRQASESLSRPYEGAGLGLSISKAYTEILGGRIWMESVVGQGSVFYFTLPVEEFLPYTGQTYSDHFRAIPSGLTKGQKILIVEDDDISMNFLEIVIGTITSNILKARSGLEAVEIAGKNADIVLILMDIKMPVMDGLEATRQIRKFNPEVIIVAQTAYSLTGDREKAIEAGCNDYLSKPIKKEELEARLKMHLK